jgi:hypothetical protein
MKLKRGLMRVLIFYLDLKQQKMDKNKKHRINIEYIYLTIFILIFLYVGCSNLFENRLSHDFPYAYFAGDAFHHHIFTEMTKEQGGYLHRPHYMFLGYNDTVPYNPVIIEHISAGFSHISGLEVYDSIYLLQFIMILMGILVFYFFIRKFNKRVAILSLPFSLLLFTGKYYTAFTWGKWELIPAQLFLIGFFWSLNYFDNKFVPFLTGLFLGAAFMTHVVEGIWGMGFLFFAGAVYLITKRFDISFAKKYIKENWKKWLIVFIVFLIMTFYYLPIFKNSHYSARQGTLFKFTTDLYAGSPVPFFNELGIFWIIFGVAIIFFLLSKNKKNILWFMIPIYTLIISLTNYIGFDKVLNFRLMWPIYLSSLFGFGVYIIISKAISKRNILFSMIGSIVIIVILFFSMYNVVKSPGMMDKYHWESLNWIKENTPADSEVYYFYGSLYMQGKPIYYSERMSYRIEPYHNDEDPKNYLIAMQNNEILRYYKSRPVFFRKGEGLYRKGLLSFGHHFIEDGINTTSLYNSELDICNFDYYVIDKITHDKQISNYNVAVANRLLSNENIIKVFENEVVVILKNNNKGVDCVGSA